MFRRTALMITALAMIATLVMTGEARASADYRVTARLFGSSTLKGKSIYKDKATSNGTRQDFKVEVENGVPLTSYEVRVNGALVSTIILNAFGRAELEMRTASFIDDSGDEVPLPAGFARINPGDTVTVGPIAGVFFDAFDSDVQRFRIEGDFDGVNSINGSVKYQERFKNGALERRFDVEIEDASPGQTYNIVVRGAVVGTLTVGPAGTGEFQLRTAAFIDSTEDGQPMPDSFPSLTDGETVNIGAMTATLLPH